MKNTNYIKTCTRRLSDEDIEIWKKGEIELKKLIGVEMHSKFVRVGDKVDIYYDEEEGNEVYNAIKELLTDEWFNNLCDDFFELIKQKKMGKDIDVKMMPALIIFDEIDNYPEIASDYIKRRLMRVRTNTHEESYK